MKIKNKIVSVFLILGVAGCSSKMVMLDTVFDINQPYRVIKHNFKVKYEIVPDVPKQITQESLKEPEIKEVENQKKKTVKTLKHDEPVLSYVDVEFYNESSKIKNADQLVDNILNQLNGNSYLIVGHSHGKSNVGVETLAAKRAEYMSNILQSAGVKKENIFYISSWSDGTKDYSISKGVRVFALPETLSNNQSLITGIITKRG